MIQIRQDEVHARGRTKKPGRLLRTGDAAGLSCADPALSREWDGRRGAPVATEPEFLQRAGIVFLR